MLAESKWKDTWEGWARRCPQCWEVRSPCRPPQAQCVSRDLCMYARKMPFADLFLRTEFCWRVASWISLDLRHAESMLVGMWKVPRTVSCILFPLRCKWTFIQCYNSITYFSYCCLYARTTANSSQRPQKTSLQCLTADFCKHLEKTDRKCARKAAAQYVLLHFNQLDNR